MFMHHKIPLDALDTNSSNILYEASIDMCTF